MLINKSQDQLLSKVNLDLRNLVFSHEQLYVVLSCITNIIKLHIFLQNQKSHIINNII